MDSREERIGWCRQCKHRKVHLQSGIICGLTDAPPFFTGKCPTFELDIQRIQEDERRETEINERTRKARKRMAIGGAAVVFAVIAIIVGLFVSDLQDERDSEELIEQWAIEMEDSLWNARGDLFNEAVNLNLLTKATMGDDATLDPDFKVVMELIENDLPGERWVEMLRRGGDVRYLSYYYDDYPHAIFRTYDPATGINFYDFTCQISGDEIQISDCFEYRYGIDWSKYYRIYLRKASMPQWNVYIPESSYKVQMALGAYDRAKRYIDLEDYAAAQAEVEGVSRVAYTHEMPQYLTLSANLHRRTDLPRAQEEFGQILEFGPDNSTFKAFYEFQEKVMSGEPDQARKLQTALVNKTGPDDIYSYYIGLAEYNAGRYHEALASFNLAVGQIAHLTDAHYGRLWCLLAIKEYDQAGALAADLMESKDPAQAEWLLAEINRRHPEFSALPSYAPWFAPLTTAPDSLSVDTLPMEATPEAIPVDN